MSQVTASVNINSPIEKIFQAVIQPDLLPQWDPAVSKVANIIGNPEEKGSSVDHVGHSLGMTFTERVIALEIKKPNKALYRMEGFFYGTCEFVLESQNETTKMAMLIDYNVSGGLIGKIANKLFLQRVYQSTINKTVLGLKKFCET